MAKIGIFISMLVFLMTEAALAVAPSFMYQGRIVASNGQPLEYHSVSFQFTVLSPDGSCVIYKEQRNGVNMVASKGVFDTPIGTGTISYPTTPSFTILDAFSNAAQLTCDGGVIYTPTKEDGRRLRVQFYDGAGWNLISPDQVIRSVPYAGFAHVADSALRLGTRTENDFILKNTLPATACSGTQVLSFNGSGFVCVTDQGGSAGTITAISGTAPIVVTGTTSVTISASVGTTANTLAAGNDSRFSDARTPTGSAGGDLSGTYPNPSITTSAVTSGKIADNAVITAKINDGAVNSAKILNNSIEVVDFAAGTATGQVFRYSGSAWEINKLSYTDLVNANGVSPWPSGSCTAGQYITWVSVADGFSCSSFSSSAITTALGYTPLNPANNLNDVANLTTARTNLGLGAAATLGVASNGVLVDGGNTLTGTMVVGTNSNHRLEFETHGSTKAMISTDGKFAVGTTDPFTPLHVAHPLLKTNTSRQEVMTLSSADPSAYHKFYVIMTGGATNADRTVNLQTAEHFVGNMGNLSLQAEGGNVGIGLSQPSERLDVSGNVKATGFCIGASCITSWPSSGGGGSVTEVATGTGLTGGPITGTGTISIANGGVGTTQLANGSVTTDKLETLSGLTSATYGSATVIPSITVDIKGRITAISTNSITTVPAASGGNGMFLKSNGTSWAASNILFTDIKNSSGTSAFNTASCGAHQTVAWSSLLDTFTCQSIGSLNASTITDGTIDIARLPASVTGALWTASGASDVVRATGSVAVGSTSPAGSALLDLTSSSKGFLPPRMTTAQRNAITTPSSGLHIYNTDTKRLEFYDGTNWSYSTANHVVRAASNVSQSGNAVRDFNTKSLDPLNEFNLTTDRFQPASAGKYLIIVRSVSDGQTDGHHVTLTLRKNGVAIDTNYGRASVYAQAPVELVSIIELNGTSDYVDLSFDVSSGTIATSTFIAYPLTAAGASSSGADNLGNHTLGQNLIIASNWISGDGDNEGIRITADGKVGVGTSTPNERLTVAGTVESTGGGFRYPDATTQATSAFGPSFCATIGTSNSAANTVYAKAPFDTVEFDSTSSYSATNRRFTPNKAGYYRVSTSITYQQNHPGAHTNILSLAKNGTSVRMAQRLISYTASYADAINIDTLVYLNGSTDYLEVFYTTNASTATIPGNNNMSSFCAEFVRP